MKRILVTGGSGFIGAATVRQLVAEGHSVALLLRKTSSTKRIDDILDRVTVIYGDMQNIEASRDAIAEFSPDVIAHLAWLGVKGVERNSPEQVGNVFASVALYRLGHEIGVRRFVGLGSQAEYGPYPHRIDESVPTKPTTTYGAAKLATYHLIDRMADMDGISFAWLRVFSTYGPGDDPSWLIPYMSMRLIAGERPSLTAGEQIWDYLFVEDAAAAVVATLNSDACGVFNLGSGQAYSLRQIITNIRDLIDPGLPLGFGEMPYRPDQVMHLEADISALVESTGWKPAMPLKKGLTLTIEWFKKWKKEVC